MASDFNKILYHKIEEHVKRQVGEQKFKKDEWRKIMDHVMDRFAQSLVAIVASVEMAQRDSQQLAAAEEAAKARAEGSTIVDESAPVAEPVAVAEPATPEN